MSDRETERNRELKKLNMICYVMDTFFFDFDKKEKKKCLALEFV